MSYLQTILIWANDRIDSMSTAKQMKLVGEVDEIHLEKHRSPSALTPDRTTVTESLAPLAPISLENADLYLELQRNVPTSRARALLETTTSRIPELLSTIALDEHRIAMLYGLSREALVSELDMARPLPDLAQHIDPGTPADLVRRRPDVSASEERLHAATEQIGLATADLFPRVNFAGLLGFNEFHGDTPFDGVSASKSIALFLIREEFALASQPSGPTAMRNLHSISSRFCWLSRTLRTLW
jgi:multidrug efflux system outer membrane protein